MKSLSFSIAPICNALCAIITIGDYKMSTDESQKSVHESLQSFPVDVDYTNLNNLFSLLNYKTIPEKSRSYWDQQTLISFLKNDIYKEMFDENDECKYDALIVCISGHGMEGHIISSDYKRISKTGIHRILSVHYPKLREIPRIFLFDSCEGNNEFRRRSTLTKEVDLSKYYGLGNISVDAQWNIKADKNPDYRLVEIHAANAGFMAKYNSCTGSHLIQEFTRKMTRNIIESRNKTLGYIFDKIQNDMHEQCKQQTKNIFYNNTRMLKLKVNST